MLIDTTEAIRALETGIRDPITAAYGKALALRIKNPSSPALLALALNLFQYGVAKGVSGSKWPPLPKEVSDLPVPIQDLMAEWALKTVLRNLPSDEARGSMNTAYVTMGLFCALCDTREERKEASAR